MGGREEFLQDGAPTVGATRLLTPRAEPNLHPFPTILTTILIDRHFFTPLSE
jgi:hypothetical protein